jgi:hypothetical protein
VNPVHSLAELVLGYPAFHERGLQGTHHLLAVGMGRAEPAAAPAFFLCHFIAWPSHHCASPNQPGCGKA